MAKGKDFYGKEVAAVIEDACRAFGVPQEELDIEVLETGSAGIFGLCKKKAHIRVLKKQTQPPDNNEKEEQVVEKVETTQLKKEENSTSPQKTEEKKQTQDKEKKNAHAVSQKSAVDNKEKTDNKKQSESTGKAEIKKVKSAPPEPMEPPTEEILAEINKEIVYLLELMGYPSQVALAVEGATLNCHLSGEYEEVLVGSDGRTLDSLQYLLRKMISRRLPDRMMLALDAGNFRERRAEELKERAKQLAEEVKETGKTQAIPALNPAERRVVHMILQEDKAIRSRSVGEGLFKKVLIYKPGKGNKSPAKKRRGRQGGRPSEK